MTARILILTSLLLSSALFVSSAAAPETVASTVEETDSVNVVGGFTSSTEGPRYEVLRDADDSRPCFRIDKYTGSVWKLPYVPGVTAKYYDCPREPSEFDSVEDGKINYQLIVDSCIHAFLLNLNTGEMWEYTEGPFDRVSTFRLMTKR